ncbi:MAG: Ig-like domain repeat protein, partial [Treponema sp.]|nr:Ig-like domain repeat protein [Treponema sp.]
MKGNAQTGRRIFAMNVIRKFRDPRHFAFAAIVALGLGALLFSACENPFRAGLGTIVDLHYPTVNLVSPAPGSPIRGEQEFTGIAWDDMSLEFVHFMITPGPDYDDLGGMLREGYTLQDLEDRQLLGWQDVNHLSSGRNRYGNWDWNRTIDTRLFRDGPLNIRLRVRDTAGNEVETRDDIVFFIRNNPPVISMDFPRIVQGEDPGQLGSEHLNFNFASDFSRLLHRVDPLIGVSGMITDENGLAMPPQFRIWEIINPDPDAVRRDPISGIRQLRHDELPGPDYGWQPIGGDEHNRSTYFLPVPTPNPGSLLFFYTFPLPDAQGRFFAMQVRAQSNVRGDGGNYETLFPRDEWTEYQWYRLTPEQRIENSFVAFLLESPQEPPQLELLRFQDILRQDAWDPNLDDRQGDYRDIEIDPNEAHYFLTETVNVKRGSFTLRVRASHLEEVSEAVAFWDDGVERGLFIWDTATEHWNSDSNVDAQTNHFTRWGYADPNRRTPPTRNFIFTYQDDAEHDFHADDVHDSASGRYRIQRFRGDNWNVLYRNIHEPGGWDALLNSVNWENAEDFWSNREEITIRVYARAELGRVSQVPLITTLAIDREPPTVALSRIDGSAGERLDEATGQMLHIVNGVIRVMLSVDDAGSGLRNFIRPDGSQGDEEIMFVLMGENYALSDDVDFWSLDKTSLDGLFAYGSAVDRNMMMRTSRTHAYEDDDDLLEDGRYWLYVFARDRAFNVGRERFLLEVDAESDLPRFYFDMGINPAVTNPSVSADGTPAGFYVDGSTRNRLRPADNITFTIRDDDSLDLGTTSGEPSTLRVSIVGSSMDATTGEIRPLDFDDPDNDLGFRLYLSDAQIKSAFPPQSVIAGNRVPVREWMGTVTQGMFLELLRDSGLYDNLLRDHPTYATNLPDGIFRINMEVRDDPSNKLAMPMPEGGYETADAAMSHSVGFWIAVDERRPVFSNDIEPPDGSFISARDDEFITGTVSDQNGPISVVSFNVRNTAPGGTTYNAGTQRVRLTPRGNGVYGFSATISMSEFFPQLMSGEFVFYLTVEDRFGNRETLRRIHIMDNTPPTVTLRPSMGITTFERPSAANRILADSVGIIGGGNNDLNASRLANMVLNFAVDAADDFAVAGIHWWLLPANAGVVDGGVISMPSGGTVASFWSFPAREANPQVAMGTRGAFGRIAAASGEAFIDTFGLNLPDGEYRLHVIAVDEAGNESVDVVDVTGHMQTIFLFQAEDRPYFTPGISPAGSEVRGDDLVVTGIITDDDGFGTGMFPDSGSIEIWISTVNNLADGVELDGEALRRANWHRAVPTQGLSLIDGTNLALEVNLLELDWSPPFTFGEGEKYYVIRAQDSHVNKLSPTGGPASSTDRVAAYSQVFRFIRDVQPPELVLTHPQPGQIFGDVTLYLVGTVSDANLSVHDGNPYLLWRLNGIGGLTRFPLTAGYITGRGMQGGIETVSFRIPHARIFGDRIIDGPNTLELRVEDKTGASDELSRGFIRDTLPPEVGVRTYITTFERASAADRIPGINGSVGIISSADLNATRLANKVLDFAVDATDNIAVGGIHWWLLPADVGVNQTELISGNGTVASFWAFPARESNPQAALGTRGAFGRIAAPGGSAFIDTAGLNLPDGEYRLHVIALDSAGNESVGLSHVQTIFLFQAEDRPYFASGISPDGGEVRGDDLVVTGIITDDDGFGAGMFPEEESVQVWISANNNLNLAAGEKPNSAMLGSAGWHSANVPTESGRGLTLIDGTNLVLNIDLQELDWSPSFTFGDGDKHFVIRAQDSAANKLSSAGGPAASTDRVASYSRVFHFIRDTLPPELYLESPIPGQIVPNEGFNLVGFIADANLSRHNFGTPANPDYRRYLLWRL